MFLAGWKPKTTVFTMCFASGSKNHGIYSVFVPAPSKNTGIYAVFTMLQDVLPTAQVVAKSCEIPKLEDHALTRFIETSQIAFLGAVLISFTGGFYAVASAESMQAHGIGAMAPVQ